MTISDEELRDALDRRAAASPPIDLASAARAVAATPRARSGFTRARVLALGSAGASVIIAITLAGSLVGQAETPTNPPIGRSPAPSSGSVAGATGGPVTERGVWSELTWRQPDPAAFIGAGSTFIQDALATGDGYIVVGYTATGDTSTGRIWLSEDGSAWRLVGGADFAHVELDRVLPLAGGYVAIGSHLPADGGIEAAPSVSAIWWSADGESWEERPAPEPGGMVLDPIAAGPDGLLALARNLDGDQFWLRSDNDLNWTRRKAIWNPDVRIFSLAAGTSGWLALGAVGVGTRDVGGDPEARSSGAIWTSPDGLAWDPAAVQAPGGQISQAARVAGGLLAIGSANDLACEGCDGQLLQAQPLSWSSPDGTSWTPVPGLDAGVDRFTQTLVAGDAAGSRVLAFDTDSTRQFRIRETVDGLTWHQVRSRFVVPTGGGSPDSTFRLETPAVGGTSVLAFQQSDPGTVNPVAWLGSPP